MKTLFYHSPFVANKQPRVTICGIFTKDEGTPCLKIGVARCSQKDNFSRKKGRLIAEGRANKRPAILYPQEKDVENSFYNFCRDRWMYFVDDHQLIN